MTKRIAEMTDAEMLEQIRSDIAQGRRHLERECRALLIRGTLAQWEQHGKRYEVLHRLVKVERDIARLVCPSPMRAARSLNRRDRHSTESC